VTQKRKTLYCSFCRRDDKTVDKLIGGPGVHICDRCVEACNAILAGKPAQTFTGWDSLDEDHLLRSLAPSEATVEAVRDVLQIQVDVLRKRGMSWTQIGEALGISRQAAWERFS